MYNLVGALETNLESEYAANDQLGRGLKTRRYVYYPEKMPSEHYDINNVLPVVQNASIDVNMAKLPILVLQYEAHQNVIKLIKNSKNKLFTTHFAPEHMFLAHRIKKAPPRIKTRSISGTLQAKKCLKEQNLNYMN